MVVLGVLEEVACGIVSDCSFYFAGKRKTVTGMVEDQTCISVCGSGGDG